MEKYKSPGGPKRPEKGLGQRRPGFSNPRKDAKGLERFGLKRFETKPEKLEAEQPPDLRLQIQARSATQTNPGRDNTLLVETPKDTNGSRRRTRLAIHIVLATLGGWGIYESIDYRAIGHNNQPRAQVISEGGSARLEDLDLSFENRQIIICIRETLWDLVSRPDTGNKWTFDHCDSRQLDKATIAELIAKKDRILIEAGYAPSTIIWGSQFDETTGSARLIERIRPKPLDSLTKRQQKSTRQKALDELGDL